MSAGLPPTARGGWLASLATALRWGAFVVSLVLIALGRRPVDDWLLGVVGLALAVLLVWRNHGRTVERVDDDLATVIELGVAFAGVLLTGGWSSPYVPLLAVPVLMVAFGRGSLVGLVTAAVALGGLGIHEVVDRGELVVADVTQAVLLLGAGLGIGLFARRIVLEAGEEHEQTLGRIQQLGHVNAMLSTLHDLVRTMPAPLSVDEIVRVIRAQLDQLFDADAVVLLMSERPHDRWRPVYAEGIRIAGEVTVDDLPEALRTRGPSQRPVIVSDLEPGAGLWDQARSGAYLWLWSRGQPTGILALEHREPDDVPVSQSDDLERLGVPLALAIDNAVWFQRLRTLGAEEERQRIGADLHDRFAQSLAYIAMELDRTVRSHPDDPELGRLREQVRSTLADLRETLRELRLNVSEEHGLVEVLEAHVTRFGDRYGLFTDFSHVGDDVRAPLPVEQQLLRMSQDLLALAQREMGATRIAVSYETRPGRVHLRLTDDGRGTPEPELGMEAVKILSIVRERADAIGATVDVTPRPGEGTTTEVSLRGLG